MKEYHKIETLYERDGQTKRLVEGKFRNKAVEYLQNAEWEFTEKIDGTNIRVVWDGHKVSFYGRTDAAQIHSRLLNRLLELFGGDANEQLFEQKFANTAVMLCGEGYGEKIQKGGGNYISGQDFILFDVMVGDLFLTRDSVNDIATYFGIKAVPFVFCGNIQQGVDYVKQQPASKIGTAKCEGLIGRPIVELMDRQGRRVIVKIKVADFQ